MDHSWAYEKLHEFADAASKAYDQTIAPEQRSEHERTAFELEPIAQQIMNAYQAGLGDYVVQDHAWSARWSKPAVAALRASGLAKHWHELRELLRPDSPQLLADRMHPWVWESAAPMWQAAARREAVSAAARTINARIQQKVGRDDISEKNLALQAFSQKPPELGQSRLWLPGNRKSPSWESRQEGMRFFAAGCFQAIRNPAAHDESVNWSEQEVLEYLAAFSALARWVELSETVAFSDASPIQSQAGPPASAKPERDDR